MAAIFMMNTVSIGSGIGLVFDNRWQAITWTNDDSVHRRIYVSPSLNVSTWSIFSMRVIYT